ncbi:photosystem I reaction center subunit N, chloroplastic [Impatiens glandulifera]|uniref:photosystem I reaction center subunit N, chloroplastic n=1 Tax=Impatiens glandulifera TaxID=253017 RepID=UPI001FB08038|nr:photosystem I reaction center subunit N, chloroplastic [Impatiens glandulifera]
MAAMNSSVLACNYSLGSSDLITSSKFSPLMPATTSSSTLVKCTAIKSQQVRVSDSNRSISNDGRRAALLGLAGVLFAAATSSSSANAGVIEDYLEKSKANKELNDKKRLATSGANFARAYTVQFGTCKFPQNFTGCQDLAKQKKVPFLSEDIELECEGKDKYKCGSNVFWKW